MGIAGGKIHIEIEGLIGEPLGGDPSRITPVLQGSGIGCTGGPGIVSLILQGKGGIGGEALRIIGDRVAIGTIDPMPVPLGAGIRAGEVGGRTVAQSDGGGTRSRAIGTGGFYGHLRRSDGGGGGIKTAARKVARRSARRIHRTDRPTHRLVGGSGNRGRELFLLVGTQTDTGRTYRDGLCAAASAKEGSADGGVAPAGQGDVDFHVSGKVPNQVEAIVE